MKLLLDNNILIQILAPSATGLTDPTTKEPLDRVEERAKALIDDAESKNALLLIPTPVLSEFLMGVAAEQFQNYLDILSNHACFEIVDFDTMAAIECAMLPTRQELAQLAPNQLASKLKYDRQIIAIALATGVDEIWTHDYSLGKIAMAKGLAVKSLADIEPAAVQAPLFSDCAK